MVHGNECISFHLFYLENTSLKYNQIVKSDDAYHSLKIQGNPLVCNLGICELLNAPQHMEVQVSSYPCASPFEMQHIRWKNLTLSIGCGKCNL